MRYDKYKNDKSKTVAKQVIDELEKRENKRSLEISEFVSWWMIIGGILLSMIAVFDTLSPYEVVANSSGFINPEYAHAATSSLLIGASLIAIILGSVLFLTVNMKKSEIKDQSDDLN